MIPLLPPFFFPSSFSSKLRTSFGLCWISVVRSSLDSFSSLFCCSDGLNLSLKLFATLSWSPSMPKLSNSRGKLALPPLHGESASLTEAQRSLLHEIMRTVTSFLIGSHAFFHNLVRGFWTVMKVPRMRAVSRMMPRALKLISTKYAKLAEI